jgi:hypothetical protein
MQQGIARYKITKNDTVSTQKVIMYLYKWEPNSKSPSLVRLATGVYTAAQKFEYKIKEEKLTATRVRINRKPNAKNRKTTRTTRKKKIHSNH